MAQTTITCATCAWSSSVTTSKVTGKPGVVHAEAEDDAGAIVVSHGLAWPVPSDQVINELAVDDDETSDT